MLPATRAQQANFLAHTAHPRDIVPAMKAAQGHIDALHQQQQQQQQQQQSAPSSQLPVVHSWQTMVRAHPPPSVPPSAARFAGDASSSAAAPVPPPPAPRSSQGLTPHPSHAYTPHSSTTHLDASLHRAHHAGGARTPIKVPVHVPHAHMGAAVLTDASTMASSAVATQQHHAQQFAAGIAPAAPSSLAASAIHVSGALGSAHVARDTTIPSTDDFLQKLKQRMHATDELLETARRAALQAESFITAGSTTAQ
jgi:hypothetical protein